MFIEIIKKKIYSFKNDEYNVTYTYLLNMPAKLFIVIVMDYYFCCYQRQRATVYQELSISGF